MVFIVAGNKLMIHVGQEQFCLEDSLYMRKKILKSHFQKFYDGFKMTWILCLSAMEVWDFISKYKFFYV